MVACAQCRQRKVRCRGGPTSCEACTRLGFQCSYSAATTSGSGSVPTATRKRGARACDACRVQKARCTADTPKCFRCQQLKIHCHYSLSVRQYKTRDIQRPSGAISAENLTAIIQSDDNDSAAHSTPTTASEAVASLATSLPERVDRHLGCEKVVVRQHIDAYFEFIYPVPLYSFLHRADFLSKYTAGTVSPALLLAVCAVSSRFLSSTTQAVRKAKLWIDTAERMLFHGLGRTTLEGIQTLAIIGLYYTYCINANKSFLYVALAARMAYYLKLHKEDGNLSFVDQECRRRLLWCIFIKDRFQAGGVAELIVLHSASIHIQLPCPNHHFQVDTAISMPHLHSEADSSIKLPMSNYLLRIFDLRNRILQYTKSLLDESISPEHTLPKFQKFEQDLEAVKTSLPSEFVFSTRAYQLRAFSPERTTFITLHIYYHHCHCELYRLLNPGYREALPQSVISSASPDLVGYAQSKCLEHALAIGEIIASTHNLVETDVYSTDASCFVILYQASCAILYACHRDSPAYTMSPNTARRYFVAFIETLAKLLMYFPRWAIFVNDIRNMLRSIDEPNAPLPAQKASTEVDFRARPVSSEENSDEEHVVGQTQNTPSSISSNVAPPFDHQVLVIGTEASDIIDLSMQATMPTDQDFTLGAFLESPLYNFDSSEISDQGLLWDWADALESGFNI